MPSYVIQLKDGARFITNRYWNEGNQIKFYLYGGIMGVDQSKVEKITESESLSPDSEVVEKKASEKIVEPEPPPEPADERGLSEDKKIFFLEEKTRLEAEIQEAIAAFNTAKKNKDPKQIQAERKKLLALKGQLSELRATVKETYEGKIPDWWPAETPVSKE